MNSTQVPTENSVDRRENLKDDPTLWVRSPFPRIEPEIGLELHEMILEKIRTYGTLQALTCAISGKGVTYEDIYHQAISFGAALIKTGVKKGDIAAILLPNCVEYPVAVLGCWCAGMTLVTMNPRYTEHELLQQFTSCDIQMIITDSSCEETALKAKNENPSIHTIILVEDHVEADFKSFKEMIETDTDGVSLSSGKDTDTRDTIAWLPFSSGTTGPPKLAVMSHAQLILTVKQLFCEDNGSYLSIEKQDRFVAIYPLFHISGFAMYNLFGLYCGAHTVLIPRFEPSVFLKICRDHKPTELHLVTPLITHIVNSEEFTSNELESVEIIMAGGAPVGKVLIDKLIEKAGHYVFFKEGYGKAALAQLNRMTEMSFITLLDHNSKNTKVGSCGRCMPSITLKVVDVITGETLGPNKSGEILAKGPLRPKGYHKNEEATKQLIDDDGWVHTGDVAYYDEDGYFYIVDRIKELIKVKGFQVAPSELENLLRKYPKVADCAVIGIPSEEHGEVPKAIIVPKCADLQESEIHAYLNPLVATFKQLKGGVEFVESIAKTQSGKILRREIREEYSRKK